MVVIFQSVIGWRVEYGSVFEGGELIEVGTVSTVVEEDDSGSLELGSAIELAEDVGSTPTPTQYA